MQDVVIPGYVHLFKISIGGRISFGETEKRVCRFVASQGMSTSLAGLNKFLNEFDNHELVELKEKHSSPTSLTAKHFGDSVCLTQDIDIFIATEDLSKVETKADAHFICYADSYMDSPEEFKNLIAFALS